MKDKYPPRKIFLYGSAIVQLGLGLYYGANGVNRIDEALSYRLQAHQIEQSIPSLEEEKKAEAKGKVEELIAQTGEEGDYAMETLGIGGLFAASGCGLLLLMPTINKKRDEGEKNEAKSNVTAAHPIAAELRGMCVLPPIQTQIISSEHNLLFLPLFPALQYIVL